MKINNKITLGLLIALVFSQVWLYNKVYQADNKIAYIDTGKLLQGSLEMKGLKSQLDAERAKIKANLDTLTMEFQSALKEYEKNTSKMTLKEKELTHELLRNKQNSLAQYQQAVEQKTVAEEQKKTQEILSQINTYIAEYGEQHDFKMILATVSGNIAYGDKGVDITDEIIKKINEK